jgi:hypothetical protein
VQGLVQGLVQPPCPSAHDLGLGSFAPVHVEGQPAEDRLHLFLLYQPGQQSKVFLAALSGEDGQRAGCELQRVADGDPDARQADVERHQFARDGWAAGVGRVTVHS